jgi:hypothetical protein
VRNQGISRFHPRDWTRTVTASQFGQRTPSGRIARKKIVAAMMRRMKNPTKITPNHAASVIAPFLPPNRGRLLQTPTSESSLDD